MTGRRIVEIAVLTVLFPPAGIVALILSLRKQAQAKQQLDEDTDDKNNEDTGIVR